MGIAGAALYSLALIGARELLGFPSRANGALRWAWQSVLDGAAQYGASHYAMPPPKDEQLDGARKTTGTQFAALRRDAPRIS
jgi:hypothetical protein